IAPPDTLEIGYKQMYLPDTNILITRFLTLDGVGEITDYMPISSKSGEEDQHYIVRVVEVVRGTLVFDLICRPAFNYARDLHDVYLSEEGAIFCSEALTLGLSCSIPLQEDGRGGVCGRFVLQEGQKQFFRLESATAQDIHPHCHSKSF